jgi:hypothetical protein
MKDEAGSVNSFTQQYFFLDQPIRLPHFATLISVTLPRKFRNDRSDVGSDDRGAVWREERITSGGERLSQKRHLFDSLD